MLPPLPVPAATPTVVAPLVGAPSTEIPVVPAPQPGVLVGNSALQPSDDTDPGGLAEAFQYVAPVTGTVQSLWLYVDVVSTAPTIEVGIYSDVSGHPQTLLGAGTIKAPVAGAWNAVALGPLAVSSGATYWLSALASSGTLAIRDSPNGSAPARGSASSSLKALPASWSSGSSWSNSPASFYASEGTVAQPPPVPPANTQPPAIVGAADVGQTLRASTGTWTGEPTSFSFQWESCDAGGEACSEITGAVASSYTVAAQDAGRSLRVRVTARNAAGSESRSSAATSPVPTPPPPPPPPSCAATVTPTMGAAAIAATIVSAADGSTVCMQEGAYPAIVINGAQHGGYVTVRPEGEARVVASSWEVIDSSHLRFEGIDSETYGFRTRAIDHVQWIGDRFSGYRGIVLGSTAAPAEEVSIEDSAFEGLKIANEECSAVPAQGEGQGVTLENASGVTIAHNRFKEVVWHYIQGGEDTTVEDNLFEGPLAGKRAECTHSNVWQIFKGSENDIFSRNVVRGEPGHPAAVTPILFEHGVPEKEGPYPCSDLYTNVTMEGNLFIDASTAYVVDIANTNNLVYSHNTVVGGQYGTWLDRSDVCGAGTNLTAEHNIAVGTWSSGAPARFVVGDCVGACKFEYNVSDDATASSAGSAHYVTKWAPAWASTTYGQAGYYQPTGLPFAAGYEGGIGP